MSDLLVSAVLGLLWALGMPQLSAGDDRDPAVALFAGAGVGTEELVLAEEQLADAGFPVVRVRGEEIRSGGLSEEFAVVIFPGGRAGLQSGALGHAGREEVRRFVREGGGYVGICAGGYLALSGSDWGLGILNARTVSPQWRRGRGMVQVEVLSEGGEITGIPAGLHEIYFANGPILISDERKDLPPFEALAYFRTEIAENNTPVGVMVDSPAIVSGTYGEGRVLVSSPHPENTDGLASAFLPNAVHLAGGESAIPDGGNAREE